MKKPLLLIVDDEPSNIKLLGKMLSENYRMRVARNGTEALERSCITPQPDLILLDIMMPGMDGYEVCRKICSQSPSQKIPIIFVTAKIDTEDIVKGFDAGAVDYITKPFWRAELLARVSVHLELKFARETLERQKAELERQAAVRDDVDRMIRHDLKGALTPVVTLPKFICTDESISESSKHQIKVIENAGKKLLELIDLSVLMIKMERGSYPLHAIDVDVAEMAQEVVFTQAPLLMSQSASVEIFINRAPITPSDQVPICGETVLCFNMLNNLVKNAAEAAYPKEAIRMDITTTPKVSIKISNRRPVPKTIRETFFEKYVTAEKSHGTGIGSYSAKLMAEAMGAEITMSSSDERGTQISVSFNK